MADRLASRLVGRVSDLSHRIREPAAAPESKARSTIKEFLESDALRPGDIILYRRDADVLSSLVQWATGGNFSHVAMVFYTAKRDQGFDKNFVIESDQGGVDLTPLEQYLCEPAVSIAILRPPMKKSWLSDQYMSQLRGHMMEAIADNYDYGTIERIGSDILLGTMFGFRSMVHGSQRTLGSLRSRPASIPKAFICSGLVQVGYMASFIEAVRQGHSRPESICDVVFRNDLLEWFMPNWSHYTEAGKLSETDRLFAAFLDDLRATTPADFAASINLEWRYLIHRGWVYTTRSPAHAMDILRGSISPRKNARPRPVSDRRQV